MADYALTKRAEEDLFQIFLFGYDQFGSRQAEVYAAELANIFQLLAENPLMGRNADKIAPGVRRHEFGSHVILYEEASGGVRILAVVHGKSMKGLSL